MKEKIPLNATEQVKNLPNDNERLLIALNLYKGIVFLLESFGIQLDLEKSSYRIKNKRSIESKLGRRGESVPLRDLYGIRIVTGSGDRNKLIDLLERAYPMTPAVFPDGKPRVRDYADPVSKNYLQTYNPYTSKDYSALHVNIAFTLEGSDFLEIAEVQILTAEELDIYAKTRREYLKRQSR